MKKNEKMRLRAAAVRAAGVLCALSFMLSLASCSVITINYDKFGGKESDSSPVTDAATEPVTTEPADSGDDTVFVPPPPYEYTGKATAEEMLATVDFDFDGETVFIRSTYEYGIEQIMAFTDEDDDAYSVAKYERCRMIEDALGCRLRYTVSTLSEMKAELKAAITGEKYYADLLAVDAGDMVSLVRDGLLFNLYSLPFFDLKEEFFHPATAGLAAGNSAFGVVSYATIDPDEIPCVFYDTGRTGSDIDALVLSGNWTWDELLTIAGDGGVSISADAPGDAADRIAGITAASAGLDFVSRERGASPKTVLPDGITAVVDVCRRLTGDGVMIPSDGVAEFAAGHSVFHIGTLGDMKILADADVVWSAAPVPGVTAGDEGYRALMPETSLFMCVPVNTTNPSGATALLRAFAAASYAYLIDAYSEYSLYNTVRLESTVDMVALIYGTAYYDFVRVYGSDDSDLYAATYALIAEAVGDSGADIERLFSKRKIKADSELGKLF